MNDSPDTLRGLATECFAQVHCVQPGGRDRAYYATHITDELLLACARAGVCGVYLPRERPRHGDRYVLSDDGILAFCFQNTATGKPLELTAERVVLSVQFFNRLVEVRRSLR